MNIFFIYIIKSTKTGRYYIGVTTDIGKRISEHNAGKTRSTKHGVPWVPIMTEKYYNKSEAYKRERQIKSYKSGEAFKKLIDS